MFQDVGPSYCSCRVLRTFDVLTGPSRYRSPKMGTKYSKIHAPDRSLARKGRETGTLSPVDGLRSREFGARTCRICDGIRPYSTFSFLAAERRGACVQQNLPIGRFVGNLHTHRLVPCPRGSAHFSQEEFVRMKKLITAGLALSLSLFMWSPAAEAG